LLPRFWVCTSGLSFCVGDYKLIWWSVRVSTRWYQISVQPPSRSFCTTPKNREPLQLQLCVMHFHVLNICKLKQRKLNCELDKNADKSIFEEWPTKSGPCRTNMHFFSSRRLPLRYCILNCIYS
jgi:hypothetical protein